MPKYNVVFSISYTIEAEDEGTAEDLGWEELERELQTAGLDGMVKDFGATVEEDDR